MSSTVDLKCSCGTVQGTLTIAPKEFFHVECFCCDCQLYAYRLNNEDKILSEHGGSELFQTYPANVQITAGHSRIACMQLTENSLYRWHTTCCDMPLANTTTSSKMPFVGLFTSFMEFKNDQEKMKMLGPIAIKAYGKYIKGPIPKDVYSKYPVSYLFKMASFMLKGKLNKKHTPSPFFNGTKPIVEPVLASE